MSRTALNFAIILAAGSSTRMGRCKAALPWINHQTLLAYQATQWLLAGMTPVIVLSPQNAVCRHDCPPESWIVMNPDPSRGKTSSILAGLATLPASCQTIAITAVDQPRSAAVYHTLLQAHQQEHSLITLPQYGHRLGHPVLFADCLRPQLSQIREESQGVRQIVQRHRADLLTLTFQTPAVLSDLNTPEDYWVQLTLEKQRAMKTYSLDELNQLNQTEFVSVLGGIFEQTPAIAHQVWQQRPFHSLEDLHQRMVAIVQQSSPEAQLALIQAHPDLGTKARMAEASVQEQAGAGLDRLSPAEFDRLQKLNHAYQAKFGFPFIVAVKNHTKASILASFEQRLHQTAEDEKQQALAEIAQIAKFRLAALLSNSSSSSGHLKI
jgi:2-oxo-4-hydroxy-4-carboxy-5-ureidoimidazoline decarboxylase